MPDLKPYFAENTALHPTETGIDAMQQAARRLSTYGSQIAQAKGQGYGELAKDSKSVIAAAGDTALEYLDHKERSEGALQLLKSMNGLTADYNQTMGAVSQDPNRADAVSQGFMEKTFEPAMQKFQDGFHTERGIKWAEEKSEALRQHFTEKVQADRVTFAGMAASKNVNEAISVATNTAYQDGHSMDMLLQQLPDMIKEQAAGFSALKGAAGAKWTQDTIEKAKVSIIAAGVKGAIERSSNPEATAAELTKKYPEYIRGSEAGTLAKAARTQMKFNEAEARAARTEQKQNEVADYNTKYTQIEANMIGRPGGPNQDDIKAIRGLVNQPGAKYSPNSISTIFGLSQRLHENPPEGPSNPDVVNEIRRRATIDPSDPDSLSAGELAQHFVNGDINKRAYQETNEIIRNVAQDPKYRAALTQLNQFTANAKNAIVNATPLTAGDPAKTLMYDQFQRASYQLFREAFQRGGYTEVMKTLDATSPTYIGKILPSFMLDNKAAADKFLQNMKSPGSVLPAVPWRDVYESKTGKSAAPVEPRKAGESPAAYMARTGGK